MSERFYPVGSCPVRPRRPSESGMAVCLVGAENPVTSCDLHVFVDEAAEPVSS